MCGTLALMMGMVVFSVLIAATGAAYGLHSGLLEKQKLANQAGHRSHLAMGWPDETLQGFLAINQLGAR